MRPGLSLAGRGKYSSAPSATRPLIWPGGNAIGRPSTTKAARQASKAVNRRAAGIAADGDAAWGAGSKELGARSKIH